MRKTKTVVIQGDPDKNRDAGRHYVIREMSAAQAERWGIKMMEALAKSGATIPPDLMDGNLASLAIMGLQAIMGAPSELTGPLLDEMFQSCVSYMPNPAKPEILRGAGIPGTAATTPLIDDDTEEISTRLKLRDEVFNLHVGFSIADFLSQRMKEGMAAMAEASKRSLTETSDELSAPSSQAASPAS